MSLYDMEPGMKYHCQRCTECCKWPGEVVLEDHEIDSIAKYLGMTVYEFIAEYTDLRANRAGLTLQEKEGGACVLLDGDACRINPVKPEQCAAFPNRWNFKGWREKCEAVARPVEEGER